MKKNYFKGRFCSKEGFTLIELLVVVLIIGILAAVAVPQYQKAVRKARLAEMQTILSSLEKAAAEWMLINPLPKENTDIMEQLSIDFGESFPETYGVSHCNPKKKMCLLTEVYDTGVIVLQVGSHDVTGDLDIDPDYSLRTQIFSDGTKTKRYNYCNGVDITNYGLETFGFLDDAC